MKNFFAKLSFPLILTLIINILATASIAFSAPAFAAGLEPFNADKANPDSLRFVFNLKAGESIDDAARVTNNTNQPVNVEVLGRDGEITSDGQLTVTSNSLENQKSGKWIQLDQTKYTVAASSNIKVPFKVSVPQGTQSGEYYAGLSVIELGDTNDTTSGNVTVKTRLAVKVFITVQGDLTAKTNVKTLNIIDPKDTDYNIERAKYGKIGKDDMFVNYEAENTGNIFLKLNTKYKITSPNGSVKEFSNDQDISPNNGSKKYYLETGIPFQVGKTKVEMSYDAKPTNLVKSGSNLKSETVSGTLVDEIDISQADLDNFAQSRAAQIQTNAQPAAKAEPVEVKITQESPINKLFLGTIIVLLMGIIIIQLYTFVKKNKNTDTKKNDN
jgi:hypothetical protein